MSAALVDSRMGVEQAVHIIEWCATGGKDRWPSRRNPWPWPDDDASTVRQEIAQMQESPRASVITAQAKMVWDSAVKQRTLTAWLLRTYRPVTMLVFQICKAEAAYCTRLLAGNFATERDFPVLTGNAGKLASAPLKLCDARPAAAFLDSLAALRLMNTPCTVVCDWLLEGDDLAAARRASRESEISFSCWV